MVNISISYELQLETNRALLQEIDHMLVIAEAKTESDSKKNLSWLNTVAYAHGHTTDAANEQLIKTRGEKSKKQT